MPNATMRANARAMPAATIHLRARLAAAADKLIAALDALDEPHMDMEDGHDAEANADDAEPSLGSTHGIGQLNTWGAQNRAASIHGEDLEYDGDTVADCDREDGHDQEDDPAEAGIGDADGLVEQTVGEPSLGATAEIDQDIAWAEPACGVTDGEATETVDDLGRQGVDGAEYLARQTRQEKTRADLRKLLQRRQQSPDRRAAI